MRSYLPMDEGHKLTKKEKKELRKLEWQEKAKKEARIARIKRLILWTGIILVLLAVVFALYEAVIIPSSGQSQSLKIAPVATRDIKEANPKAKIVLVEYADFQCPACAAYHAIVSQLVKDYKDKILYVYRMFPLSQGHPNAVISAQAAYAAYKQGEFAQYGDLLFARQNEWVNLADPKPVFITYAQDLKLDLNKFEADMLSLESQKYVQNSESQALNEGIYQTPTFFLNNTLIKNPTSYDDFKQLIDASLNQK